MLFMIQKIKDLTKLGRDEIIIVDNFTFKFKEIIVFGLKAFMVIVLLIEIKYYQLFQKKLDLLLKKLMILEIF